MIRTRRDSQQSKQIAGINITPFTDVCLVLLIILMVTAPALIKKDDKGINVPLPQASKTEPLPTQPMIARIEKGAKLFFNNKPSSFEALPGQIKAELQNYPDDPNVERTLVVKADENIPYRLVIKTIDIAGQAGVSNTYLATRDPEPKP